MGKRACSTTENDDEEIENIMNDPNLNAVQRIQKKQRILNSRILESTAILAQNVQESAGTEHLTCAICLCLCDRPVTAPCQHNFCLKCFRRWLNQGKKECPTCRAQFPVSLTRNPRVNTMLASRVRRLDAGTTTTQRVVPRNDDRPEEAFMSKNAKRHGMSNASSGRIKVTCPSHHFGPIGPEFDPERGSGLMVGETWTCRLHCRQWGAHFPHVAGIAGQANAGAQSIILSGGYEDDKDEGEWLLYTGSGGRDLSGNKRTSRDQTFDQVFESSNKALLKSCQDGLPVRVLRSHKEKRSAYAPSDPDNGIRYDGIYKIVACWRHKGRQGRLMCRYLFRRCDNETAPWCSKVGGDGPWNEKLPEEATKELETADGEVFWPVGNPYWDYDKSQGRWRWFREQPVSKGNTTPNPKKEETRLMRDLAKCTCGICNKLLDEPICTPCAHQFCKSCLMSHFGDEPQQCSARSLRVRRAKKPCPQCKVDLTEFLGSVSFHVNLAMVSQIKILQEKLAKLEGDSKLDEKENCTVSNVIPKEDTCEKPDGGLRESQDED